jgi:hypothetical protein
VHLDAGYDSAKTRDLLEELGCDAVISIKGFPLQAGAPCLRDCGLVTSRPQGRASMWSLATGAELLDVLAAAERLLATTGDAVALCPTYGEEASR